MMIGIDRRALVGPSARGAWVRVATGVAAVTIALAGGMTPAGAAQPTKACPIAKWNVSISAKQVVSGGCTCHVALRVGVPIPWSGNAAEWWRNATWTKNTEQPKTGAIAAFSYGHVSFIESVRNTARFSKLTKTEQTVTGYREYWRRQGWRLVKVKEPIYRTAKTYQVEENYRVTASNQDFYRAELGVYLTSWAATRTYTERDGKVSNEQWTTPRTGDARGLQGYIYRP